MAGEGTKQRALEALARCRGLEKQVVDFTDKTKPTQAEKEELELLRKRLNNRSPLIPTTNNN